MTPERHRWTFRSEVVDLDENALEQNKPKGEVSYVVSVFDEPDTGVAYGNTHKQVIDRGAFQPWISRSNFEQDPVPMFVDHGDAPAYGYMKSTLKVGRSNRVQETKVGLRVDGQYNLQKEVARDAFSDLQFDKAGSKFSFSNLADEKLYDGKDGYEHVAEFPSGVIEFSQVGIGAQRGVKLLSARTDQEITARQMNLDELPNRLRDQWMRDNKSDWEAYVMECWADSADAGKGFVIAHCSTGDYQVPWTQDDKGVISFDRDNEKPVERTWVQKGKKTAIRTALLADASELADAFSEMKGHEHLERMRAAIDEALKPNPMLQFYSDLMEDVLTE